MRTVLIDAHSALWRLAMKMPVLSTSFGTEVQLVYGFFRLLHGSLLDFEPDRVLVLWDEGIPKLRISIYQGYKEHRIHKKTKIFRRWAHSQRLEGIGAYMPPDNTDDALFKSVMTQRELIKDALPYLGISQFELPNTEADDLISIACQCLPGKKIVITADRDMLQLVNEKTKVFLALGKKRELYTYKNFEEKIGLTPRQFVEVKALSGDAGDGVPSIAKGFGEGTARELIKKWGSMDELWEEDVRRSVMKMTKTRFHKIYSDGAREAAYRNLLLVDLSVFHSKRAEQLIRDRVVNMPPMNELKVRAYFHEQEFKSLMKDFHSWIVPFKELGRRQ